MSTTSERARFRFLKPFFLLIPSLLILVLAELVLIWTEGGWETGGEMAPSFVLERQGGLFEIQRRISVEAGTGGGDQLASERMYRWDRELFWRLHPNLNLEARNYLVPREWGELTPFTIQTNSSGLRMARPLPEKKEGLRIICMGNSCTFGWGVNRDETYPRQLEKLIVSRMGITGVEVWNAGIPGYTSDQGVRFFEKEVSRWDPDILVLSFGFNDSRLAAMSDRELHNRRKSPIGRVVATVSRWRLYRFLESVIRQDDDMPEARPRNGPRVSAEDYGRNLGRVIDEAKAGGITPVLLALVMPEDYRREIGRVAERKGVLLAAPIPSVLSVGEALSRGEIPPGYGELDLPAGLAGSDPRSTVFGDPIHPNALGNYMVAMQIAHDLLAAGLLEGAVPQGGR